MRPPPVVTGISPAEGPPGTRVTIRGENLGVHAKDVTGLTICDANCVLSADYKSAGKIIARMGHAAPGKGDVIVTTRSGGEGTCTVQFKCLKVVPDPLKESAIWVEEVDLEEMHNESGSARPGSPSIMNQDPLGIVISDIFGFRFQEEQLEEYYPEGSGTIQAENFHPGWFLLERHGDTSFDTLKNGLNYLRREESRRSTGPLAFVKENLGTFLNALDKLNSVQRQMLRDESECKGGSIAQELESLLQTAGTTADALFQDVLKRKDDADRTRNALNVLQRFRFLFSLPQSIERNIKQGEYEMVISDYSRAKSLFAETDIKIFKKVLQEVETKIESFRVDLRKKLHELPSPLEEQKRLIRYLVDLHCGNDPAWDCLLNQQAWVLKLLISCRQDHQAKDTGPLLQVDGLSVDSDLRTSRTSAVPVSHRVEAYSLVMGVTTPTRTSSLERQSKSSQATPQRVLFTEELSDLLTESLPDLWRLGQAYFNGSIINQDISGASKHLTPTPKKKQEFESMIKDVTSLYADMIKAAFLPSFLSTLKDSEREKLGNWHNSLYGLGAWLPSCVRNVRCCLESLSLLDLPSQVVECVSKLARDLRVLCATQVFKEAVDEVKSLHCNETWNLETDENMGRITTLPLLFENVVMETLHVLKEITLDLESDSPHKDPTLKKKATEVFKDMLQAFIECLQYLAFQPDQESDKVFSPSPTKWTESQEALQQSLCVDDDFPVIDERLLIVMNNCRYVRQHVVTKLVDNFTSQGYYINADLRKTLQTKLEELEGKIFDAYIEQKGEPLVAALEPGMAAGGFKWYDCLPPQGGVRSYVKEAVMSFVMVHAQVFSVSSDLLSKVFARLTELLADEFERLFIQAKTFTSAGAVTAHLETRAIQEALAGYMSQQARESFQQALKPVPPLTKDSDKRLVEAMMTQFNRRMRFQLLCFQVDMEEL